MRAVNYSEQRNWEMGLHTGALKGKVLRDRHEADIEWGERNRFILVIN